MAAAIKRAMTTRWRPTRRCWSSAKTSPPSAGVPGDRKSGETFGEQRCFDTPLAEAAIIGVAVGLAVGLRAGSGDSVRRILPPGLRPDRQPPREVPDAHRGAVNMAVTVRIPSFGGIGAVEHHSESTETYWAHTAGLKVVAVHPVGRLLAAAACDRRTRSGDLPRTQAPLLGTRKPSTSAPCPAHRRAPRSAAPGDDVTVVTYGGLVGTALHAAELAAGNMVGASRSSTYAR